MSTAYLALLSVSPIFKRFAICFWTGGCHNRFYTDNTRKNSLIAGVDFSRLMLDRRPGSFRSLTLGV